MAFNLFGFKLSKDASSEAEKKKVNKSFAPPVEDDGAVYIEGSSGAGFYEQQVNLDHTIKSDADLIKKYRTMAMNPECEAAIEDIVSESLVCEENQLPLKIVLDRTGFSESIKNKIDKEFSAILKMLDFHTKGYEIYRRWFIDSRIVYHIIIDENDKSKGITELRYIDPVNIRKIKKYIKKQENNVEIITGVEEFYMYSKNAFLAPTIARTSGNVDGVRISPDSICFIASGLYDASTNRVVGYLNKAIKALNQLQMMEDSIVIYRMSRAPERRIFYVDVGNLPAQRAEQYMKDLINRYRNRLIYNSATGEVVDERRHLSMLEDYWLPRREGGRGTEVRTLDGAQNLLSLIHIY